MSSDKNLQAMEEDVKQSKTAVNANAAPAQPMEKLSTGGTAPTVEDLGGPTPENYSPTNDSAKLKDAAGTLKQVRDVVNKKAVKAEGGSSSPRARDRRGPRPGAPYRHPTPPTRWDARFDRGCPTGRGSGLRSGPRPRCSLDPP